MPYGVYNEENIKKKWINIEETKERYLEKNEYNHFEYNLRKWNLIKGENYNIIEYSNRYCEIDCDILEQGYNIYKGWIKNSLDLNIDNILTSASLSDKYLTKEGCYENCY